MKVIQDNRPTAQLTYPFRVTCSSCKSILEIEQGDVLAPGPTRMSRNGYCSIECPLCHHEQLVKPDQTLADQCARISLPGQCARASTS